MKRLTDAQRALDDRLHGLLWEAPPAAIRISIDGTIGTPAIASMLKKVLEDRGAIVTFSDDRIEPVKGVSLKGLKVHIDRITWVRSEEAARWNKP